MDVSEKGAEEAIHAGKLMHNANLSQHLRLTSRTASLCRHIFCALGLDVAFTSYQKRAIKTLNLALEERARRRGLMCPFPLQESL